MLTTDLVRSYKMEIITDIDGITGAITETVLIDRGNGEFTSMLKSAYDEMIAKQDEAKTK
jgi:hypothetical protein